MRLQIAWAYRNELLRKQVQVLEMAKLGKELSRAEGDAIIIRDIDFLVQRILQAVEVEKIPNLRFRLRQGDPRIVELALVVVTVISDANAQALREILFHGRPFYSMNRRIAFVRFYHFTQPRPYYDRIDIRSCRQRREPMRKENKK